MSAYMVNRNPWSYFLLAIVEGNSAPIERSNECANLLDVKWPPQKRAADTWADGVLDFSRLQVETGVRKLLEIARVVPVQMSSNDVINGGGIDPELSQTFCRASQEIVPSGATGACTGATVNKNCPPCSYRDPNKEIHWHRTIVRVRRWIHKILMSLPPAVGCIADCV
jgi:hypothetical protein